jgi:hypothetical protein
VADQQQEEPEYDNADHGTWEMPSVVAGRLTVPTDLETLKTVYAERDFDGRVKIVRSYQPGRWQARWHEWNATTHGVEQDRFYEIYGCMHSTGERFALALAAGNEVALRIRHRRENPTDDRGEQAFQEITHRAMAELWSYYLLGTGHSLAALTMKAIALEIELRPALLDKLGVSSTVGSQDPKEWPSLTKDVCRQLRRVAKDSQYESIKAIVAPITAVVLSTAWEKLDAQRGEEYHRNRPPSAHVDAPFGSAYELDDHGNLSLSHAGAPMPANKAHEFSNLLAAVESLLADEMNKLKTMIYDVFDELAK